MSRLDLTDLRILDELQRTGSISRTAKNIGLSQPSVSLRLGRLRRHFNDLLFVRTAHAMSPTHAGDRVITAARQALELLDQAVSPEGEFDAETSSRTFRICMTSSGQLAILPKLLTRIEEIAPRVSIEVLNPTSEVERMLEAGDADLAIGVRLERQKGLLAQTLFREHHVCLVSKKHRRVGNSLSLQQFMKEAHVETHLRTASMGLWMMDQSASLHTAPRRVAVRVPSLIGLPQIVASTDLMAIVPYHVALALTEEGPIKMLDLPVDIAAFPIVQYWHRRYHSDPGNRWLRATILALFSGKERLVRASSSTKKATSEKKPLAAINKQVHDTTVRAATAIRARRK